MPDAPLFRKIDCVRLPVPNLDEALAFYRDGLGLPLIWRTDTAAGLSMPETDTEIVLQSERPEFEVDLLVDDADVAAQRFGSAGGRVLVPPFDIQIGRAAVVMDAWGNVLVLLDQSKGRLTTDSEGRVTGVELREPD
jgi:catechol 2,3-dioxygenase-like lactoylglutathione lyase family enzyme